MVLIIQKDREVKEVASTKKTKWPLKLGIKEGIHISLGVLGNTIVKGSL